ncbi:hypothetical protein NDU88_008120 [Pleurodeles waltl]|uniref:Uncharacterized protein n=1 Tax=Pleurodeles waltl TaxID=8319 RepID=A0AAV7NVA1_PLEWA|nr:hypothetical protein NDU88_008120 [Pleurodeles waltl]
MHISNPPTSEAIYQCIMSHREETRLDSRRAQAATCKLQRLVCKIAKSGATIGEWLSDPDAQSLALEADMVGAQGQLDAHKAQLIDIPQTLEDQENHQCRNNLRALGVTEGKEGSDIRHIIVELLQKAFRGLLDRNWSQKIQQAHRVPLVLRQSKINTEKPRAILVYIGNCLQ